MKTANNSLIKRATFGKIISPPFMHILACPAVEVQTKQTYKLNFCDGSQTLGQKSETEQV